MVTFRLTKLETEELILWGRIAQDQAETAGLPFEPDEVALLAKLRAGVGR